jgi:hypothetical protein
MSMTSIMYPKIAKNTCTLLSAHRLIYISVFQTLCQQITLNSWSERQLLSLSYSDKLLSRPVVWNIVPSYWIKFFSFYMWAHALLPEYYNYCPRNVSHDHRLRQLRRRHRFWIWFGSVFSFLFWNIFDSINRFRSVYNFKGVVRLKFSFFDFSCACASTWICLSSYVS